MVSNCYRWLHFPKFRKEVKPILYTVFCTLFLLACEEKNPLPEVDAGDVRNIGLLSTTEYTVGKVIVVNDSAVEWYEFGDRKILISCHAKVKAGIDLKELKDGAIKVVGNTIKIELPPSKITSFTMDPGDIHTEMEDITGFRNVFTQEDKNAFMRQGEESIRDELDNTNILKDAEDNAVAFLVDFYTQQGFEKVIVKRESDKQ